MSSTAAGPIGAQGVLLYAAGSLGTGVFSTVPSVLLLYFCTETMRIPAVVAGMIVFIPKLWGLFWDPFVGAWSDRTSTRFGRRRPFIAAGAVGTAVAFGLLFSPPFPPAGWQAALWIGASYCALVTCYGLFAVPYVALPSEIVEDGASRARLVGWRMTAAMTGVLAGAGFAPLLVAGHGGGRAGYAAMAVWIGTGAMLAMACPLLMLRNRDRTTLRKRQPHSALGSLRSAFQDRAYRPLIAAYVCILGGAGMISAETPYLLTMALGQDERQIGTVLGVMLIVASLLAPAIARASRRVAPLRLLVACIATYFLAAAGITAGSFGLCGWNAILGWYALAGLAFAGLQVLPYTLVAELTRDRAAAGLATEAAMTGVWTAAEKLGLALSPLLTGLVLGLQGHDHRALGLPILIVMGVLFLLPIPLLRAFGAAAPQIAGTRP